MYILLTEIKQELQSTKVSISQTHHAPSLRDHTLSIALTTDSNSLTGLLTHGTNMIVKIHFAIYRHT